MAVPGAGKEEGHRCGTGGAAVTEWTDGGGGGTAAAADR